MKYYKCLSGKEYPSFFEGKIYPENSRGNGAMCELTVYMKAASQYWEEVPVSEYLLQEAKEKYPIGTVFIPAHVNEDKYTVAGNWRLEAPNTTTIIVDILETEFKWIPCVYYSTENTWAKIVSKSESKTEEKFVLPEAWYVKVTKENQDVLSKWRFGNTNTKLEIGYITGMYDWGDNSFGLTDIKKEHNHNVNGKWKNEITFEQFEKYVLKTNNKETMEKKIIGYKLIKPEYEEAALKICIKDGNGWSKSGKYHFSNESRAKTYAEKAGVLDLWFEPVYEEEFKIGDWVFVENGGNGAYGANNFVGQICNKQEAQKVIYHGEHHTQISEVYVKNQNTSWGLCKGYKIRKATPEEIKKFSSKFKSGDYVRWDGSSPCVGIIDYRNDFGGYECYVLKNTSQKGEYTSCSANYLTKITKEEYLKEFKPKITIKGYEAEISDTQVKFGCQTYSKEFILQLGKCLKDNNFDLVPSTGGVTINDSINKLVEYYETK